MGKNTTVRFRNIFFVFGFLALVAMVWCMGLDEIIDNVVKTGWWFFAIIGMWLPIYMINTAALNTIIRDENPQNRRVPFWHIFKINVSGFALKAATPLGFIGGDPYKIMELTSLFGVEKATSSTLLYTMSHITAQCIFWTLSIVVAALFLDMSTSMSVVLLFTFLVFVVLLVFLWKGYRKGLTVKFFKLMCKLPILKRWVHPFCDKYHEKLIMIDQQISYLYNVRRRDFLVTLSLEFLARFLNCVEVFLIMMAVHQNVTMIQSIVIYSFMSLFTNIFFFSPMQIGTREGGFLLAFTALSLPGWLGAYVSLITRIRELIWIGIGVLLMKIRSKYSIKPAFVSVDVEQLKN